MADFGSLAPDDPVVLPPSIVNGRRNWDALKGAGKATANALLINPGWELGGSLQNIAEGQGGFGDYLDAGVNAAGAVPGAGVIKGLMAAGKFTPAMFAGILAKTADRGALAAAEKLAAKGAPKEQIWNETGWFKGADDKWRFEIPDDKARLNPILESGDVTSWRKSDGIPLSEVLKHDDLGAAYPNVSSLPTSGRATNEMSALTDALRGAPRSAATSLGGYTGDSIVFNSPIGQMRSTALHEAQHPIQGMEGFARGGSPTEFGQQTDATLARDALSFRRELGRQPKGADRSAKENAIIREYQQLGAMDWLPSREARDLAHDIHNNPTPQLEELVNLYGLDKRTSPYSDMQMYKNLAGEVESRNVQKRMDMTPEQRRAAPPWTTEDVPREQQIVRFDTSGPQAHAPLSFTDRMEMGRALAEKNRSRGIPTGKSAPGWDYKPAAPPDADSYERLRQGTNARMQDATGDAIENYLRAAFPKRYDWPSPSALTAIGLGAGLGGAGLATSPFGSLAPELGQ